MCVGEERPMQGCSGNLMAKSHMRDIVADGSI
jgi:hypothetical protein